MNYVILILTLLTPVSSFKLIPPLRHTTLIRSENVKNASHGPTMYSPLSKGSPVIVIKGGTETRKAWKKRRRTQSPLLLPCTITELPKTETLLGGLLYLLGTHGTEKEEGGAKFMGVGDLEGKWRSVYKCDFRELCRGAGTDLETIVQTRDSNIRIKVR